MCEVDSGRPAGISAGGFPRVASRTRRASHPAGYLPRRASSPSPCAATHPGPKRSPAPGRRHQCNASNSAAPSQNRQRAQTGASTGTAPRPAARPPLVATADPPDADLRVAGRPRFKVRRAAKPARSNIRRSCRTVRRRAHSDLICAPQLVIAEESPAVQSGGSTRVTFRWIVDAPYRHVAPGRAAQADRPGDHGLCCPPAATRNGPSWARS